MQTTLLGLAIACILALLTALVGPYFIDWNDHRAFFETEASRLTGLNVQVGGPIDVRLLPFPSVSLGSIEIGPAGRASRLRARSLDMELTLGPLLKGEMRATTMRLVGPEFSLGLNSLGRVDWPAMTLASDALSIDKLEIEDGRAVLTDAVSGSQLALEKLWFKGQVRSLTGPISGEGAFVSSGGLYGYRVEAGRLVNDGVRVKLNVDTAERPVSVQAEGLLAFDKASPRFDGTLNMMRPVGTPRSGGKMSINEPWRLTGKLRATPQSALLEQVEFQYGPDERAAKLSGTADFTFGEKPALQAALSARQFDLDQLIATPEAPRRLPLAAMQRFIESFSGSLKPPVPVQVALSFDALTIGGATLQTFGSDLHSDGDAWQVDKLDFRAPGFTKVSLSGRVDPAGAAVGFSGAVSVDANDPKALMAWLAGRAVAAGPLKGAPIKPWKARGDVTLAADRIAVDRLKTEFERGTIEGRLAYVWPAADRAPRLDAELSAGELDVDGLIGFGNSALAGLGLEWPRDVSLGLEIGRARLAGFEAVKTSARLKLDGNGIAVERFSVADFGRASVEAKGRITTGPSPGGNISVDLDARELGGVIALAEKFASPLAPSLRMLAARQKTAKLHADVSLDNAGATSATAKLALDGRVGALGVHLNAGATGKPDAFTVNDLGALAATDARFDVRLDAEEGGVLLALLGLDRIAPSSKGPAQLAVNAAGPLSGELNLSAKLSAGAIDANGAGTARLAGAQPATVDLSRMSGTLGGSEMQGRLALRFAEQTRVDGRIETDTLDAPAVIAAAAGIPPRTAKPGQGAGWSLEPFGATKSDFTGQIEFSAQRAVFSPTLTGQRVRGTVRFSPGDVVFDGVSGEIAGGRIDGRLALVTSSDGVSAKARIGLSNVDAAKIISTGSWPALTGRAGLQVELAGTGLSPAAFVGSLSGNGTATLEGGQMSGLNPRVFDALVRAVDLGIPTDANRIKDFVATALNNGDLPITGIDAGVAINGGLARLTSAVVRAKGADLALTGSVNLADSKLDALLTLSGAASEAGSLRPTVFVSLKGPVASPSRTIDTNALAGWIALRAVEQQSQRLEAMEKARAALAATPPPEPANPAPAAGRSENQGEMSPAPTAPDATNTLPAAEQAPALPPATVVKPAPRPATPRAQIAPHPENAAAPAAARKMTPARAPVPVAPKPTAGWPLDLLGAQN